ncbi:MAG: bifunctional phosphoribosylaminoimidazolecarboxamide formyltransferase/IMP cyclohydrolase, partial [Patescibacteria group bacterium]
RVTVICQPIQYTAITQELISSNGVVSNNTRENLAIEAFSLTAGYDSLISNFFWEKFSKGKFAQNFTPTFEKVHDLRYGENYQQKAALYREPLSLEPSLGFGKIIQGKEMSFNNYLDAESAMDCVKEFAKPAACIVKHTNSCGVAEAETLAMAFQHAFDSDQKSAFGGIIALNRKCDGETAKKIISFFNEVVVAPEFDKEALRILAAKKNLRLIEVKGLGKEKPRPVLDFKKIVGGLLVQERNVSSVSKNQLKFVTQKKPSDEELESLLFAWRASKHVKSNAIVVAVGTRTIGISGGQTSRVDAVKISLEKAGASARGAVLASDSFFPFPDNLELAFRAGISAIIQPGGSLKDPEIIKKANELGLTMVFTGVRNFKH